MRSVDEIQRAHDILVQLILDQELFDAVVDKASQSGIRRYCEVLCWALGHHHNTVFEHNFKEIVGRLEALGCEIFKYDEMQTREAKDVSPSDGVD